MCESVSMGAFLAESAAKSVFLHARSLPLSRARRAISQHGSGHVLLSWTDGGKLSP